MRDIATKSVLRWGGECYLSNCPFHFKHAPECDAETRPLTDEDFNRRALCKQQLRRCYQCNELVSYLFSDSRCAKCTKEEVLL